MKKLLVSLTAAASLSMGASAFAETTLKATTAAPPKTPWVTHLEKSAENLSGNSGGAYKMEVFAASQLGVETETIKQTARGRLDVGTFSITAAATVVPEVIMLVSPFFWDSFEQAECAVDNHLTTVFDELFEQRGLKIVQWQELGWQNIFAREAITKPEQVAGYKMRIAPAKNNDIYWRSTGVNGVPLPFGEMASALQTGVIDGGELPTISMIASGLTKVATHITNTRHVYQPSIMLISLKTWNKMSAEEQATFMKSMEDAQALRTQVRGAIKFFEGKHLEAGGTIHDLNDEERAEWSKLYTPAMQQELIEAVGGESQRVYDAVVAARAACTK